tara:strand:- start:5153 stop:6187 length:1035 start_codon:yes stop_codon:yes gene_type:complete
MNIFQNKNKNILIINLMGIGNNILMISALNNFYNKNYTIDILHNQNVFYNSKYFKNFFENYYFYNNSKKFSRIYYRILLIFKFIFKKYDIILDLNFNSNNVYHNIFIYLLNSKIKIGINKNKIYKKIFDFNIYEEFKYNSEYTLYSNIFYKYLKYKKLEEKNKYKIPGKKYICIHPGSSNNLKFKRIPYLYYVKIINYIYEFYNLKVYVLGGKEDLDIINKITKEISANKYINLCNKTNFNKLVEILNNTKLFISGDSGLMHLAAYCKVENQISIFGPTSHVKNSPIYNTNQTIIFNGPCKSNLNVICNECNVQINKGLLNLPKCLNNIKLETIFEQISKSLNK